jgi:hypothetical protein
VRKAVLLAACDYLLTTSATLFAASPTTPAGSTGTSATTLLNQLATAFSGGNVVHRYSSTAPPTGTWVASKTL